MSDYQARVDALAQAWREWARIGGELGEQEWQRPTRCEPWQVADLYAHHSGFPVALGRPTERVASDAPPVSAVEVLRGFNAPGGIAHLKAATVAERAAAQSAAHSRTELVERFADTAPQTIAALRAADPTQPMPWVDHVVTVSEVLRIALLEATVHLLDLQRALDRAPTVPAAAAHETALLLAELAPPIEFIESATGRTAAAPPLPVIR